MLTTNGYPQSRERLRSLLLEHAPDGDVSGLCGHYKTAVYPAEWSPVCDLPMGITAGRTRLLGPGPTNAGRFPSAVAPDESLICKMFIFFV
jgi:hypothetical protein